MDELTLLSARELVGRMASGTATASEALAAYRSRARRVDAKLNAVTQWLDSSADARALELDELFKHTGKVIGPLHGVPFTIKDHFHLEGTRMTMGSAELAGYRSKKGVTAAVIQALIDAGAVPFAKTNMSERGETFGSSNPVFGTTRNPWDMTRTSGGSSAGEGALVGAGATAFGIGSDVGGSIRIPAAFSGHCALKPTADRAGFSLASGKLLLNHAGEYGIPAAAGPMARCVDDLAIVMESLSDLHRYHPRFPPVQFDTSTYRSSQKLTFGIFGMDGLLSDPTPDAGTQRAVQELSKGLRESGHRVLQFEVPSGLDWAAVIGLYYQLQAAKNAHKSHFTGEKNEVDAKAVKSRAGDHHPEWLSAREGISTYLAARTEASSPGDFYPTALSPPHYFSLIARRDKLRDKFFKAMKDQGVDVLLSPTWPSPAPSISRVPAIMVAAGENGGPIMTVLQNILDTPCGVVPVSRYTAADIEIVLRDAKSRPATLSQLLAEDTRTAEGMPLTVSITGRPWEEERVLAAMRHIERVAAGWSPTMHQLSRL